MEKQSQIEETYKAIMPRFYIAISIILASLSFLFIIGTPSWFGADVDVPAIAAGL
jgi:preprotein translocase subunit SecF